MWREKARGALRGLDFRHKKRPQLRSLYILMVRRPDSSINSKLLNYKLFVNRDNVSDPVFDPLRVLCLLSIGIFEAHESS
ncbi:Uncharacterised protein [Yersinia kristensenii]|nr:Uncharacterised protein [Yersinia kristensenii]